MQPEPLTIRGGVDYGRRNEGAGVTLSTVRLSSVDDWQYDVWEIKCRTPL